MPSFVIEQHRLATDARQHGLWCFRVEPTGERRVVAHAMPVGYKDRRRWFVYQARKEIAQSLTREAANAFLIDLGILAVARVSGGAT
ncbi:MAG: hypothetical protein JWM32_1206 [Verrucomicrobia bacterium]|nr:hypothetical protein [Verrucomicrobiota bacterium]